MMMVKVGQGGKRYGWSGWRRGRRVDTYAKMGGETDGGRDIKRSHDM